MERRTHSERRGRVYRHSHASTLLLVLAVLLSLSSPGRAATLLRVIAGGGDGATLLTLQFDEDPGLDFSVSGGSTLQLFSDQPLEMAAGQPDEGLIRSVNVSGQLLNLVAGKPVRGTLRRAGAGRYLIVVRPAPDLPATPPVQSPKRTPREAATTEEIPQPVSPPRGGGDPGAELLLSTARVLAENGDPDRAKETLESIPESSSSYGRALLLTGDIEQSQGNDSAAEAAYRQAMDRPESRSGAAARLAVKKLEEGESADAVTLWEYVLEAGEATVPPLSEPDPDAAGAEPLDGGPPGAGEDESAGSSGDDTQLAQAEARYGEPATKKGSPIKFDSNSEPVSYMNTRLLVIAGGMMVLIAAFFILFFILRNKRLQEERDLRSPTQDLDDVFWGDEPPGIDDSPRVAGEGPQGSLAAELDDIEEPDDDPLPAPRRASGGLSAEKRKRISDLQEQGFTVREIAESTGASQDEVRMALQMEGSER